VRWSPELYRIFGRDPSEPIPKLFSDEAKLFLPESIDRLRDAMSETFQSGKPHQMELSLTRPDGSIRHVAAHGDVIRDPPAPSPASPERCRTLPS
jgi:PAS domain-containing protein